MKYQKAKIAVIILCVLISGICYSYSRIQTSRTEGIDLQEMPVTEEAAAGPQKPEFSGSDETEDQGSGFRSTREAASLPCYVHICGEVVSPGVYELSEESRVFQAVEKAGGFTANAAAESLNMAERIRDGMKITVLSRQEARSANKNPADSSQGKHQVNLNTAVKEELMTLRGIGESRAEDIIRYRDSHGGFKKIEDIMKVSGIKDSAFQKIKDDITV
ncbi:helix-hairpin-helix domain-containing protein [Lacrimispora sp. JR3]|uniref:helix-hairpin-helix domain-containing protein n=1 Tax=Lacrimispora sinapis TaxID=3111456 RepID=UPI00374A6DD7